MASVSAVGLPATLANNMAALESVPKPTAPPPTHEMTVCPAV